MPRAGSPIPTVTGAVCPAGLPRYGRRCPPSGGRNTRCTSSPPFTASPSTSWMRMRSGMGRSAAGWWGLSTGTRRLVVLAACMLNPIVDTRESTPGLAGLGFGTQTDEVISQGYFPAGSKGWLTCSMGTDTSWWPQLRTPGRPFVPPKRVAGAVLPGGRWSGQAPIPLRSHTVSCSRLLFSSRDDVIGKVCITRDMLAEHPKGRGTGGGEGPSGDPSPTPAMSWSRGSPQ